MIYKILKILTLLILFAGVTFYYLIEAGSITISRKFQPYYLINDMDRSPNPKNQAINLFFGDSINIRNSPIGSVPSNAECYPFESIEYEIAEVRQIEKINLNDYNLQFGKHLYEVHCIYCHNSDGKGKGQIITQVELDEGEEGFPEPPDLTDTLTIRKSDSRLFHILSAGQNLMMPINHKLSEIERWALIRYLRELQKIEK